MKETTYTLLVAEDGLRLDRFVAGEVMALSRTAVQRLVTSGDVTVNGAPAAVAYRVRKGDVIVVRVPPPESVALIPEDIPLTILYEDRDMLAIDKPAGMVVHPGPGHRDGTLVNAVLGHCPDLEGIGGEIRPGIVHRLDRDTSGVIVVAKRDAALRALQAQFKRRSVEKRYTALAHGWIPQADGLIEAPIARDRHNRKRMAVRGDGKMARTRWHVLQRYQDEHGQRTTLLDVQLLTGRTHQIRVHMAWLGYPLAGDHVYGPASTTGAAPRLFLHARQLTLAHPTTDEALTFVAPLPEDLVQALRRLTASED